MGEATGRSKENRIQPGTGSAILAPAKLKFIVYNSEAYYPGATEYDNYPEAMKAFSKIKNERLETIKENGQIYADTDYLAVVISEFCADEFKKKLLGATDEPMG